MNKNKVTSGIYEYSLPNWIKPVFVSVFENENGKFVKFNDTSYSTKIEDIPENAIFSRWI